LARAVPKILVVVRVLLVDTFRDFFLSFGRLFFTFIRTFFPSFHVVTNSLLTVSLSRFENDKYSMKYSLLNRNNKFLKK